MQIASFQKLTLLDFPGRLACIVFTPRCNFRCGFCHNPELVLPELTQNLPLIEPQNFFAFLKKRLGLLEGVCLTGGEPTLQKDLPDFLAEIKELGFQTKLDTNGSNPKVLAKLIRKKLLDYVALDVKFSPLSYSRFTGYDNFEKIQESRDILFAAKIETEFRTTLIQGIHTLAEFEEILCFLRGAQKYCLQNFSAKQGVLVPDFEKRKGLTPQQLREFQTKAESYVVNCEIRADT